MNDIANKVVCNDTVNVVRLFGKCLYDERLKALFSNVSFDDCFSYCGKKHLAVLDIKKEYNIRLFFDCSRDFAHGYNMTVHDGVVLSAAHFYKQTKEESDNDFSWRFPYDLNIFDTKRIVLEKIGRKPDSVKGKNLSLEWREDEYILCVNFCHVSEQAQEIVFLGLFLS
ncbi:TPA: hypothetical protein OUE56_002819 [Citrobacter sedlakii]|nr:hypothetical protein [Citrobacter sedlakii]